MSMTEEIVQRWRIIGGSIGAGIVGGLGFLVSWYQPIDGEPGYKLITPEDFSIIFGFLLAAGVFGFVGFVVGYFIGGSVGENIAFRKKKEFEEAAEIEAYINEQRFKLRAMFYGILTDRLFEKKEEALSTGRMTSDQELSWEAINETSAIVREEMGFTQEQLEDMLAIDDFVASLANEEYTSKLLVKLGQMEKEEQAKQAKEINKAFRVLLQETLQTKKEEAQSDGRMINQQALATEAINETTLAIAAKYELSFPELSEMIDYAGIIAEYGGG